MKKAIIIFIIFLIVGFGFSIGYYMYNTTAFETKTETEEARIDSKNIISELINNDLSNDTIETSSKNQKIIKNEIEPTKETNKEFYILKELEGVIAIYKVNENSEEILEEKTGIAIRYLPDEDINKIRKGIKAIGKEELNQILEDYE